MRSSSLILYLSLVGLSILTTLVFSTQTPTESTYRNLVDQVIRESLLLDKPETFLPLQELRKLDSVRLKLQALDREIRLAGKNPIPPNEAASRSIIRKTHELRVLREEFAFRLDHLQHSLETASARP